MAQYLSNSSQDRNEALQYKTSYSKEKVHIWLQLQVKTPLYLTTSKFTQIVQQLLVE